MSIWKMLFNDRQYTYRQLLDHMYALSVVLGFLLAMALLALFWCVRS